MIIVKVVAAVVGGVIVLFYLGALAACVQADRRIRRLKEIEERAQRLRRFRESVGSVDALGGGGAPDPKFVGFEERDKSLGMSVGNDDSAAGGGNLGGTPSAAAIVCGESADASKSRSKTKSKRGAER